MPRVRVGPETETERRMTSLTTGNRKSRLGLGLGLGNRKNPRAPPSAAEVAVACVLRRLRDGGARGFFRFSYPSPNPSRDFLFPVVSDVTRNCDRQSANRQTAGGRNSDGQSVDVE